MNEEKLIKLMQEHFPTKTEFNKSFNDVHLELRGIRSDIKEIKEDISELKSSAKALDGILEHHPISRIERLEQHVGLPQFVPTVEEE